MGKVFVNSSLMTREWGKFVRSSMETFLVIVLEILKMLLQVALVLLHIPAGLIWFVSLGHVDFLRPLNSLLSRVEEQYPDHDI